MTDQLLDGDARYDVEVLESLVRGYLVRVAGEHRLEPGRRVALRIGDTTPVPCTVAGEEAGAVRLLRGTRVG